jgi:nitrogen fixation protein NifB
MSSSVNFGNHPCFNRELRHQTGRVHLPVAPACNIQCNFCDRKYDCINESRPGVTSTVLTPRQAITYLDSVLEKIPNISVVGIAGPGDPFANTEATLETMRYVHEKYPEKILCLATNGVGLPDAVEEISKMNISHVTVTVNAVDPEIGAKIYKWARHGGKVYRGIDAAWFILSRQIEGIRALKEKGITVKINTVVIPGINDAHVQDISMRMLELGADVQNCIPLCPVAETEFAHLTQPTPLEMAKLREGAGAYLPQMSHCARCRADAAGLLGQANQEEITELLSKASKSNFTSERPYVAVASMEGVLVNQHLGEAEFLRIYGMKNGVPELIEKRFTPEPGSGDSRWNDMAELIKDCAALLVSGVGENPKKIIEGSGIKIYAVEGLISEVAEMVMKGMDIPKVMMKTAGSCGMGKTCSGTGGGCG